MKVIDLLNKIANGEKVPDKITYRNKIFEYCDDDYFNDYFGYMFDSGTFNVFKILDDKIEIIEEDKKIEKLDIITNNENEFYIVNKINEIIDFINKEHE